MSNNIIRLEATPEGYIVKESGIGDFFIPAFEAYVIKKGETYLACFEDLVRDFSRVGSRKKDISETVLFTETSLDVAKARLLELSRKKARELTIIRGQGYTLDDRTY